MTRRTPRILDQQFIIGTRTQLKRSNLWRQKQLQKSCFLTEEGANTQARSSVIKDALYSEIEHGGNQKEQIPKACSPKISRRLKQLHQISSSEETKFSVTQSFQFEPAEPTIPRPGPISRPPGTGSLQAPVPEPFAGPEKARQPPPPPITPAPDGSNQAGGGDKEDGLAVRRRGGADLRRREGRIGGCYLLGEEGEAWIGGWKFSSPVAGFELE